MKALPSVLKPLPSTLKASPEDAKDLPVVVCMKPLPSRAALFWLLKLLLEALVFQRNLRTIVNVFIWLSYCSSCFCPSWFV